ncbi:MAG: 5-formyltetrahydrofolate cyclo-ligase [Candidatus Ranarchaeia archaeon]
MGDGDNLDKDIVRANIWQELRKVARPDSRFHWDFNEYIPDYEGSQDAVKRLIQLEEYKTAKQLLITPDNNLLWLRKQCIDDGKPYLMPTYGIQRGFFYLDPSSVPPTQHEYAATLDGMERFAVQVTLKQIRDKGRIDLLVTGASGVSVNGVRYGKGHGYFDLEWAMMYEIGVVTETTPVIAMVHDCQILEQYLPASPFDTIIDIIVSPTKVIRVPRGSSKPKRIYWEKLEPGMKEKIPPLNELFEMQEENRK